VRGTVEATTDTVLAAEPWHSHAYAGQAADRLVPIATDGDQD
jgi:hypothetical protein